MSVTVTKTAGTRAEILWKHEDDPHGYIAYAVESDRLAYVLEALGASRPAGMPEDKDQAKAAARHITAVARLLERRAAVQVVALRDRHGLSWRQIAADLFEDPDRQSSVRRMYDSGHRHIGT